ncbi:MAG: MFS transporter [Actinomycetaceae bacterium]|nr:MFS transporter [Actinomycetaceae bacterium]
MGKRNAPAAIEISILLMSSVLAFASMAVASVMPAIVSDYSYASYYPIAFGIFPCGQIIMTIFAGLYCDARGSRLPMLCGIAAYIVSMLLCAAGTTIWWYIAGRFIEGLSAGAANVALFTVIAKNIPKARQPFLFALLSAAWVLPSIIAPAIGGLIAETWGWRFLYWLFLFLMVPLLPTFRVVLTNCHIVKGSYPANAHSTMVYGVIAGIALAAVQIGQASPRWYAWIIAAIGAVLTVTALQRLFPPGTLRAQPGVPSIIASRITINAIFMGLVTLLPLMLQHHRGWPITDSGFIIAIGSVTWSIAAFVQARVSNNKARQQLIRLGIILLTISVVGVTSGAFIIVPTWFVAVAWAAGGAGIGCAYPVLAVFALTLTPPERHGQISAHLTLTDSVGYALAMALVTGVFNIALTFGGNWPYLSAGTVTFFMALAGLFAAFKVPELHANFGD